MEAEEARLSSSCWGLRAHVFCSLPTPPPPQCLTSPPKHPAATEFQLAAPHVFAGLTKSLSQSSAGMVAKYSKSNTATYLAFWALPSWWRGLPASPGSPHLARERFKKKKKKVRNGQISAGGPRSPLHFTLVYLSPPPPRSIPRRRRSPQP